MIDIIIDIRNTPGNMNSYWVTQIVKANTYSSNTAKANRINSEHKRSQNCSNYHQW